ncbi:hypothetical protein HYH02_000229 [Chlamydomonas schloesseri]|uniref:Uncharacterized protein n=1 Tax=Chlamydomonas schloesseri TaxID=2026947 RepID=A0A836B7M7_9CHLO|nr:hypothetical protein HYH02_000229 [Chlamydomonas schloesseri]|eukprot:KAG2450126.1 hypothetical protein HYH02_000229 [Chlamydomonas schloesseri]
MLIPMLLGAINKPLQLAYKTGRLAAHVRQARLPLNKLDCIAAFMLDLKGKGKLGLIWLVSKLVHGKVTNAQRAGRMTSWIDQHRSGPTDKSLESDLDKWIAVTRPVPAAAAKPASGAATKPAATNVAASAAVGTSIAAPAAKAPAAQAPAAKAQPPGPPRDPLSRAGFVFLRDCLARLQAGEEEVRNRFTPAAAGGGSAGPLNVQEALAALYGTGTVYRLSDALAASARRGSASTPEDAERIQHLLDEVYVELRVALRRDLMDMLVY